MDDGHVVQWRRDADTSLTIRLCWTMGVGTLFGAIAIIVSWRLLDVSRELGGQSIVVAALAAFAVSIVAFGVFGSEARLERLARRLPISTPTGAALRRTADAAVGTIVMATIMASLMWVGRLVSQRELLELGASPFTLTAAGLLPLAVVALLAASFLRSVGALDAEAGVLYLYDPDQGIDLDDVEAVSTRYVRNTAIVTLRYHQPDDVYVPGPRRLVLPPRAAKALEALVARRER